MNASLQDLIDAFPDVDSLESADHENGEFRKSSIISGSVKPQTVTFQLDEVEVHDFNSIKGNPEAWYSRGEIDLIKKEAKREYHYRALIIRNETEMKQRTKDIRRTRRSTLSEQKRQRRLNINDPELISSIYCGMTIVYALDARRIAKMDEHIAAKILSSDDNAPEPPMKRNFFGRELRRSKSESKQSNQVRSRRFSMRKQHNSDPVLCVEERTGKDRRPFLFARQKANR
jgi:hypothetical protein